MPPATGEGRYRHQWKLVSVTVSVNRAPVLTLWTAVVAERLGFDRPAALSLGKAMAGLTAQTKARRLGIYGPPKTGEGERPKKVGLGEEFWVELCGRSIPRRAPLTESEPSAAPSLLPRGRSSATWREVRRGPRRCPQGDGDGCSLLPAG